MKTSILLVTITSVFVCYISYAFERHQLFDYADILLRIDNLDHLKKRADDLFMEELRKDSEFLHAVTEIEDRLFEQDKTECVPAFARFIQAVQDSANGELIFAVLPAKENESKYSVALAMQQEQFETALKRDQYIVDATDQTVVRIYSEFQDIEIVQRIHDRGSNSVSSCWITHIDNTALLSTDLEWIKKTLVTLQQNTIEEPEEKLLRGNVNIRKYVNQAIRKNSKRGRSNAGEVFKIIGLNNYHFSVFFGDYKVVYWGWLTAENPNAGILSLIDPESQPEVSPETLPLDVTSFATFQIRPAHFWNQVPALLGLPSTSELEASFLEFTNVDLKGEVIDSIGDTATIWTEPSGTNYAFALEVTLHDHLTMEEALSKLSSSSLAPFLKYEKYRDYTIYSAQVETKARPICWFCISGNRLLICHNDPTPIHRAIQRRDAGSNQDCPELVKKAFKISKPDDYYVGGSIESAMSGVNLSLTENKFHFGYKLDSKGSNENDANSIALDLFRAAFSETFSYAKRTPDGLQHRNVFFRAHPEIDHPDN